MTARLQLDLPMVLPEVPDVDDTCVERLLVAVEECGQGVEEAHVVDGAVGESARMCIHYDAEEFSWPGIRRALEDSGACLIHRYGHLLVKAEESAFSAEDMAGYLDPMEGVLDAAASARLVRVEFERAKTGEAAIRAALEGMETAS
ncbi:MAG: hypothetical protein L0G70_01055 [Rubrobacter sp.]|nr:hypothetical protein [Rubrobacter sp.]